MKKRISCDTCRYGFECMIENGRRYKTIPLDSGILTYAEKDGYYYELEKGGDKNWSCSNIMSTNYNKRVTKNSSCDTWSSKVSLSEVKRKDKTFDNYTCDNQISIFEGESNGE